MDNYEWVPEHLKEILKQNDIELISKEEAINLCPSLFYYDLKLEARAFYESNKIFIGVGFDQQLRHLVLCHEIGHLLHPLGRIEFPILDAELAANEYVLENYYTLLSNIISLDYIISNLKEQIGMYINLGHMQLQNTSLLKTAKILGITDKIRRI